MKPNSTPSPFDEQDVTKMTRGQLAALPAEYPMFNICTGRYFYGMFYISIMPGSKDYPNGGNITGMFWRYNSAPEGPWHFNYRFMYYADQEGGHNPRDRRSWYYANTVGSPADKKHPELTAEERIEMHFLGASGAFEQVARVAGAVVGEPELFFIKGDESHFDHLMEVHPPRFMNVRARIAHDE